MNAHENMSGRVNVVLSDEVYEVVKDLAETERRSQSQMTAILVEEALIARGVLTKEPPSAAKGKGGEGGKE